jgi:hypothetical protein
MTSTTSTLDEAAVLSAARRARSAENAAAAEVLTQVVAWAKLHEVTDLDDAATWMAGRGQDTGIPLGGEGCPLVSEFAVAELATALGLSSGSGRNLVAQGLELFHRLPRLWARVQDGSLAAWRARRIAEETLCLSVEAAEYVDRMLAPYAHRTGPAQTQRMVEGAIARFMPDFARERRDRAADQRHFDIDTDQVSFAGTASVHGELDLADALDLEDAIRAGAEDLKTLGSTDSLDVRRAAALGVLARGQQPLDLTGQDGPGPDGPDPEASRLAGARTSTTGTTKGREVVLFAHLSAEALRTHDSDAVVTLENAGGQLLTAAQVAAWCGVSTGSTNERVKITVKPVIDLAATISSTGYEPSDRLAEQVQLRDRTCAFPWCQRPARRCDLDHIDPYQPDGPPGQTASDNLACLCRLHHRMKTHGGWAYTMVELGTFLWRSPYGHSYLTDAHGTDDLTPDTVGFRQAQPPDV